MSAHGGVGSPQRHQGKPGNVQIIKTLLHTKRRDRRMPSLNRPPSAGALGSRILQCCVAAWVLWAGAPAWGSVYLESTRVIYQEGQRDVALKLTNADKAQAALVQLWMDDGGLDASEVQGHVPFLINPPMAKIEAGKSQLARIAFIGEQLDPAHESLYWLNVLEIPPKSTGGSQLSFAIRSRIKFFYRPKALLALEPFNPENCSGVGSQRPCHCKSKPAIPAPFTGRSIRLPC